MFDPDQEEAGAVSTEYLFLMVFITLAIVVGAALYGTVVDDAFQGGSQHVTPEIS